MDIEQAYKRLMEIKDEVPELIYQNDGYQYLSPGIRETHKDKIKEIEEILKPHIPRLRRFDNFKLRKDGTFAIRCQYGWDEKFTGVGYFEADHFTNKEN